MAVPTETVYGLAALAEDESAVRRVFRAKGRPGDHPLIVHVSGMEMAARYGDLDPRADRLARRFWPGPLTLVVERTPLVPDAVTGGRDSVALRVPDNELTLQVIRLCGAGLVAPSANKFGHVSPTRPAHVLADLDGEIDLVLDGGACRVGVESTIVECTGPLQILRPGPIAEADIAECAGAPIQPTVGPARAAGMLASHYAPSARVVLVDSGSDADTIAAAARESGMRVTVVGAGLDPVAYAAGLYRMLRAADDEQTDMIVAVLPRGDGLAAAVRDRLTKAAADSSPRGG